MQAKLCEVKEVKHLGQPFFEMLLLTSNGWKLLIASEGESCTCRTLSRDQAVRWCRDGSSRKLFGFNLN